VAVPVGVTGVAVVKEVEFPLPEVVIEHDSPVRSQPAGTVSATDFAPAAISLNEVVLVAPGVVKLKLGVTPEPVPAKLNVPSPPTVAFTTTRFACFVLVNVQVMVSPAAAWKVAVRDGTSPVLAVAPPTQTIVFRSQPV